VNTDGLSLSIRALSYGSRFYDTKTITPQHGFPSPELLFNNYVMITEEFDKRLLPKHLLWGSFHEKVLKNIGFPKSSLKIVGFWRPLKVNKDKVNLDDYILYLTSSNLGRHRWVQSFEEEIFTIKEIIEKIPQDHNLVVKVHPAHPIKIYNESLKGIEKLVVLSGPHHNTPQLINDAKVVVAKYGSALMESIILKKPVLLVNFASELNFQGFENIPFVTTPGSFGKVLRDVLDGKLKFDYKDSIYCHPFGQESVSLIREELEK